MFTLCSAAVNMATLDDKPNYGFNIRDPPAVLRDAKRQTPAAIYNDRPKKPHLICIRRNGLKTFE